MRSIQVNIDRPNFTINPTNCSAFSVDSQGIGDQGTVTDFSSYFQAVNCARLPFKPKMTCVRSGGKKRTGSGGPTLRWTLGPGRRRQHQNIPVTLPKSFAIDQRHLGNICSVSKLPPKNGAPAPSRSGGRRRGPPCWISRSPPRPMRSPAPAGFRASRSFSTARFGSCRKLNPPQSGTATWIPSFRLFPMPRSGTSGSKTPFMVEAGLPHQHPESSAPPHVPCDLCRLLSRRTERTLGTSSGSRRPSCPSKR